MKEIAGDFAFRPECGGIDLNRAFCVLVAPSDSQIWPASSCQLSANYGHSDGQRLPNVSAVPTSRQVP